jgi:DNA-binding response OmpR family regulator
VGRILVVDDEAGIRSLVRTVLEREGHEVLEASGGWEALDLIEREPIDAILLDVSLGDIEGMAVLRRVRANPRVTDLPVIMLSGHTEKATVEEARALGSTVYLAKPFDGSQVVAALAEALGGP